MSGSVFSVICEWVDPCTKSDPLANVLCGWVITDLILCDSSLESRKKHVGEEDANCCAIYHETVRILELFEILGVGKLGAALGGGGSANGVYFDNHFVLDLGMKC